MVHARNRGLLEFPVGATSSCSPKQNSVVACQRRHPLRASRGLAAWRPPHHSVGAGRGSGSPLTPGLSGCPPRATRHRGHPCPVGSWASAVDSSRLGFSADARGPTNSLTNRAATLAIRTSAASGLPQATTEPISARRSSPPTNQYAGLPFAQPRGASCPDEPLVSLFQRS